MIKRNRWWTTNHHMVGPSDAVVNSVANDFNMCLAVKISLNSFISIDKVLELLLQAVVLIIQICHVFIESINFSLQVHLILEHLVTVLLEPVKLERN